MPCTGPGRSCVPQKQVLQPSSTGKPQNVMGNPVSRQCTAARPTRQLLAGCSGKEHVLEHPSGLRGSEQSPPLATSTGQAAVMEGAGAVPSKDGSGHGAGRGSRTGTPLRSPGSARWQHTVPSVIANQSF